MNRVCRGAVLITALAMMTGCPPACRNSVKPATSPDTTAASQPAGPPPELALVEDHFDAGSVKQGEVVKHTFVVKNRGLGTLNIEKVKGS